jgi:hypothetical protein
LLAILKEDIVKRVIVLLAFVLVSSRALATCTAAGWSGQYYNHIANGGPIDDDCWDPYHAVFTTNYVCGSNVRAYQFGYAGSISQTVTIPSSFTATHFDFGYESDFVDPHDDGANNSLSVTVRDMTTNTLLATDYYSGYSADVYCRTRVLSFSGNLAGHVLSVLFSGSTGYPDTIIRVRFVSLWQY